MIYSASELLMKKAFSSLLWHVVGSYLIVPFVCAPFTLGASFFWYILPFALFQVGSPYYGERAMVAFLPAVPGVALWAIRLYFRALRSSNARAKARARTGIYYYPAE